MDLVLWNVSAMSNWTPVGQSDVNQRSADLKSLVQSIVNRSGRNSGNAMAFYLSGIGIREVESSDGDAPKAPLLVFEYLGGSNVGPPPPPTQTTTCSKSNDAYISCITSIMPKEKTDTVAVPSSHAFQVIFSQGEYYTKGGGVVPGKVASYSTCCW